MRTFSLRPIRVLKFITDFVALGELPVEEVSAGLRFLYRVSGRQVIAGSRRSLLGCNPLQFGHTLRAQKTSCTVRSHG